MSDDKFRIVQINGKFDSLDEITSFLERDYDKISKFFEEEVYGIKVRIFYNRSDFNDYINEGPDACFEGFTRKGELALASPNYFWETKGEWQGHSFASKPGLSKIVETKGKEYYHKLAAHEVTHMFIQKIFPHFKVPIWIDEGIPTLVSGIPEVNERLILEPNRNYNMEQIHTLNEWSRLPTQLTYQQACSIVKWIIGPDEQYKPKLFDLMSELRECDSLTTFGNKLESHFGFNEKGLHDCWMNHLNNKYLKK